MNRSLRRKLVIGLAALAAAAFAGGAYAATQSSGPTTRQAFLDDVAKRLHVTPQQLNQALNGALDDQLQAAVNDGKLTQAQANALEQRLKQNSAGPLPFGFFGFGPHAFFGRPGLFGGGIGLLAGPGSLHAAATYLGLTDAQLAQQLSGGKSLAQVAMAKGKSVSGLEQAMTAAVKTRLDKLVSAKAITAAQEQRILARVSERIADEVNRKGLESRKVWRLPRFIFPNGAPQNLPAPPASLPAPYALPAPSA